MVMFENRNVQVLAWIIIIIMFAFLQLQMWFLNEAQSDNYKLSQLLQEQTRIINSMQVEVATLSDLLQAMHNVFEHGLTAAQVKQELIQASDRLLLGEIFGREPRFLGVEGMNVSDKYVLAHVVDGIYGRTFELLLSYEVERGVGQSYSINWKLLDSDYLDMLDWVLVDTDISTRYFQPRIPRNLSTAESVIINFYYHCNEIDPEFNLLPEAYLYISEEISGEYLWEEFIRLMYEHVDIRVWDLWFEGDKLYVDLHSTEVIFFNQGTTGSMDRGTRLLKTIASFPGISSFEVLVGGKHGIETSHFSFDGIVRVENGTIVEFDSRSESYE